MEKEKEHGQNFTRQEGLPLIMKATKCVNHMPSGRSRDLYNTHGAYRRIIEHQSNRILEVISSVSRAQGIRGNIVKRRDAEEKFEIMQECNDTILEKINSNLDDLLGVRNPDAVIVQESLVPESRKSLNASWNQNTSYSSPGGSKPAKLLTARNIQRPQSTFKVPVDNANSAFCPRIKYKPNSLKPLAILPEYGDSNEIIAYTHPYEIELDKFVPSSDLLVEKEPIQPTPIETADLMYVDNEADLNVALTELQQGNEIAVDVEHHSYRTFLGITCLLQISTRTKDYIFDTIALREELHILNEVFTNPKILKVFHGATMDIDWLQRDLSIYVVGMFDTFEAAKRLGFARLSLAYLLNHYCKINVDKTFQLADWRMRPLLEELIDYARQDTHYLLYIYDNMRNDLLKAGNGNTNLLESVYQASTETCKRRFIKPQLGPLSFMDIYRKSKKHFDNRQLYALQHLFAWRDKIARQDDESYGFVLPNHMMLQISETLPREMQGILACCNPIPPLVKQYLPNLHQFILKAREQSLIEKTATTEPIHRDSQISNNRDFENPLYCPHDIQPVDKLPCLLASVRGKPVIDTKYSKVNMARPQLSIFVKVTAPPVGKHPTFVTPYQRYKAYMPTVAQDQRAVAKKAEEESIMPLCPPKADVAEKHKLDENERLMPEERIIKKRRTMNLPGPSHAIEIFNGGSSEASSGDEEKRIVDELAHSRRKNQNTQKQQMAKPLSRKKQRQNDRRMKQQELAEKQKKGIDDEAASTKTSWTPKGQQLKSKFKNNRQDSNKPLTIDLTQVDYSRFGGGSKQQSKQQIQITQKFQGKNQNKRNHRGNFKK